MSVKSVIEKNVSLATLTTWKTGGPAKYFTIAGTYSALRSAVDFAAEKNIPVFLLGKGSNILVSDRGFPGLVIHLGAEFQKVKFTDGGVTSGAGIRLYALAREAARRRLSGLEWSVGIPGTLGGAVKTNAGSWNEDISKIFKRLTIMDIHGNLEVLNKKQIIFDYRKCVLPVQGIILEAELKLHQDDQEIIQKRMFDLFDERKNKQPLGYATAGSVFKNPAGYVAGKLIEECGLKGLKVNKAVVSTKHANFIINTGGARASDILKLMDKIKQEVYKKSGVLLEPEIELVGDFD